MPGSEVSERVDQEVRYGRSGMIHLLTQVVLTLLQQDLFINR
jgi:hypothetical protein